MVGPKNVAFVFQEQLLLPWIFVIENLVVASQAGPSHAQDRKLAKDMMMCFEDWRKDRHVSYLLVTHGRYEADRRAGCILLL